MFLVSLLGMLSSAQSAAYSHIYSLSELTDSSSRVVTGEIVGLQSRMEKGKIYTRVSVEVQKTFVGSRGKRISFDVLGGVVDGLELSVSGAPQFDLGAKGLFFLDHKRLVGFGQGVFEVENGVAKRSFQTDISTGPDDFSLTEKLPDETVARDCLQTRVDSLYKEGWAMRSLSTNNLTGGELQTYPLTMLAGKYKILACTDQHAADIQLQIVDRSGGVLEKETEMSREASLLMIAKETQSVFITASGVDPQGEAARVGISLAVLYR
jgi:hypothetical protein